MKPGSSYTTRRHMALPTYSIAPLYSDQSTISTHRSTRRHRDYVTLNIAELQKYQLQNTANVSARQRQEDSLRKGMIELKRKNDRLKDQTRGKMEDILPLEKKREDRRVSFIGFANRNIDGYGDRCSGRSFSSNNCDNSLIHNLDKIQINKKQNSNTNINSDHHHKRNSVSVQVKTRNRKKSQLQQIQIIQNIKKPAKIPRSSSKSSAHQLSKTVIMLDNMQNVIRGRTDFHTHEQQAHQKYSQLMLQQREQVTVREQLSVGMKQLACQIYQQKVNVSKPTRGLLDEVDSYRSARLERAKNRLGFRNMQSREEVKKEVVQLSEEVNTISRDQEDICNRVVKHVRTSMSQERKKRNHFYQFRLEMENQRLQRQPKQEEIYALPGSYSLFQAITSNLQTVKLLTSQNPLGYSTTINEYGQTPLIYASLNNQPQVVSHLLQFSKGKLQHKDYYGRTALHYACKGGYSEVCLVLLMGRALPWSKGKNGIAAWQDQCALYISNARKVHLGMAIAPLLKRFVIWNQNKHKISQPDYFEAYRA